MRKTKENNLANNKALNLIIEITIPLLTNESEKYSVLTYDLYEIVKCLTNIQHSYDANSCMLLSQNASIVFKN